MAWETKPWEPSCREGSGPTPKCLRTALQHCWLCGEFHLQGIRLCASENMTYSWTSLVLVYSLRKSMSSVRLFGLHEQWNTKHLQSFIWAHDLFSHFSYWEALIFHPMAEDFSKTAWWHFFSPEAPTFELSKEYTFQIQSSGTLFGQQMFWYKGAQTEAVGKTFQLLTSFTWGGC